MNRNSIFRISFLALSVLVAFGTMAKVQNTAKAADNDTDSTAIHQQSVIDEVIWVVGDEAILKSDVEEMRIQAAQEGQRFNGDPDCVIPEQLALQKLFLQQAAIDSIEVTDADVAAEADQQLDHWIQMIGSREKLEEYKKQSIGQIRSELRAALRERKTVGMMREKLVENIIVTPADVRRYFKDMPQDSLPFVPTEVEVQIITQTPRIPQEEIDRVKDELRSFTDRVTKGETSFSSLARLYSEDPGSARRGGELDYTGRGMLDPAFANVAFNLTDPNKISKVVESEFGFHIIQLIDKRGEKIKCRHILMKPQVSPEAVTEGLARLDSVRNDIIAEKFTFEQAASVLSDDKDTRNNFGLMSTSAEMTRRTSKLQMQELPQEVARAVDGLQVGEVSKPFEMINTRGKTVCAIAKLKNRVEGHKATITEDYQILKDVVLNKRREEAIHEWVVNKIKNVYVRVNDQYKNCNFEYQGWIK
ncbi:MAG: peptidylprolyl isomerase [Prevotella sp.]|nr:peptidylprolyl isomerase [Prevotella sp.]